MNDKFCASKCMGTSDGQTMITIEIIDIRYPRFWSKKEYTCRKGYDITVRTAVDESLSCYEKYKSDLIIIGYKPAEKIGSQSANKIIS